MYAHRVCAVLHFLATAEKVGRVELCAVAVCVEVGRRCGGQRSPCSIPPNFDKRLYAFLADVLRKFVERYIDGSITAVGYHIVRRVV